MSQDEEMIGDSTTSAPASQMNNEDVAPGTNTQQHEHDHEKTTHGQQQEEIFVTGYSLRAPSADDPKSFYEKLANGEDMTSLTRRYPEGYKNPTTSNLDKCVLIYGRVDVGQNS